MPKSRINPPLFILLVFIFCFNLLPIQAQAQDRPATAPTPPSAPGLAAFGVAANPTVLPAGINYAPGYSKIIIDNADGPALATAAQKGGLLLADYGGFSLWKLPATPATSVFGKSGQIEIHPEFDRIELRSGPVNTNTKPNVNEAKLTGPQLWLVQFVGPVKTAWLENLKKLGVEPVIYMPSNAYVVWADGPSLDKLNKLAQAGNSEIQWTGNYKPQYRLDPSLLNLKATTANKPVNVTVQFFNTANVQASVKRLTALGGKVIKAPSQVLNFTDITLEMPTSSIAGISAWNDVFNVETWIAPHPKDEKQDQIVAGNIITTSGKVVPSATGYLAWLSGLGFSNNPTDYPLVDVVDDGIDNGTATPLHADFYQLGNKSNPDRLIYNQNCTTDSLPDSLAGHGNLNAGIVGGYNDRTGTPYQDAQGYSLGLGVSPFGRLGGTKIFENNGGYDISNCGNTDAGVVAASYQAGAKITSNSWGSDTAGEYDATAQAYDALTRDASSSVSGNQQMLHVFAAGNAGSGVGTVGSPGTAKNVLTVGATENVRDEGTLDGCAYTGANNADDMATFSSRGPTRDSRSKPDIVAPGTHIQGPASQDAGYDGSGVCGGNNNFNGNANARYYPNYAQNGITQTLYTWSSGTSHSTPALSGAASLVYNYYNRVLAPGQTPSPAMLKGLIINGSRYLNGSGTGDTLPSNNQGWGDVNLKNTFDSSTHYCQLINQSVVLTGTGQFYNTACQVADPSKPVRVTLAWTDAPGSTTGDAFVNNLDLEVRFSGAAYKGNVFNGAFSTTGGSFDLRNNVENVFLPAGASGVMSVKVTAANLAADALSGGTNPQQDFVLIIANADPGPAGGLPLLNVSGRTVSDLPPGGNANGFIDPGETDKLSVQLANTGNGPATNVTATLTTTSPLVTVTTGTATYPDIPANGTTGPNAPFAFQVSNSLPCGQPITFTLKVYYNGATITQTITFSTGMPMTGSSTTYTSTNVPKAIPDNNSTGVTSTLAIATSGNIGKITVSVNVSHTWDDDITLRLISPQGTTVTLVDRQGGSGDDFEGTVFDDAAANPISSGTAPFTGSFQPETPLSALTDQPIAGTWTLVAVDSAPSDTGAINGWSLTISPRLYQCSPPTPQPAASLQVTGYPSSVTVNTSHPFTVTAKDGSGNLAASYAGTVHFTTNASSATLPADYTFQPGDYGQHVFQATFGAPGTFAITATDTATPSITGSQGGIVVQGAAAIISATGGTTQSAQVNSAFSSHLTAVVKDSVNNPVSGVVVTFTAPNTGAGALFSNNSNVITATSNGSGVVDSGTVYANSVAGNYNVTATAPGVPTPATYTLTNTVPPCNDFVVTSDTYDGTSQGCGTLFYAITAANAASSATVTTTITFSLPNGGQVVDVSAQLPQVNKGVLIDGGTCDDGPGIIINGSGYAGDGLTLAGGNLANLRIANFGGKQIVAGSGNSNLKCVIAAKTYPQL